MARSTRPPPSAHAASARRARRDTNSGDRIRGSYELHEIAGRGGMALVWRGTQHGDVGFRRPVAIKQMHDHLADSDLYVAMFAEEARIMSELRSPNAATIYDFVHERGHYFLVQEWVEGIDLGSFIHYHRNQGSRTRWDLITAIGIGLCRALSAAHERRAGDGQLAPVVHRDVSPHNILISTEGMVKLIDFGLALARDRTRDLTEPGIVKGKMSYLSPEVVSGNRPSPLTDVFAAGSVLWEALSGRRLFDGGNDYEVYKRLRDGQVQPLRPLRKDIPRELVAAVHRALMPDPAQRFHSAREMGNQLSQVLRSQKVPRDLHELLGRTVVEARFALQMGRRTGDDENATPVANVDLDERTGPLSIGDMHSPATPNRPGRGSRDTEPEDKGLLHKLPFFRKR